MEIKWTLSEVHVNLERNSFIQYSYLYTTYKRKINIHQLFNHENDNEDMKTS